MTKPTLDEQIEEVAREIRQRERVYPKWIAAGRLKQETADQKLEHLRAAQATLQWLFANMDWIRPIAVERRQVQLEREMETQFAANHPAVKAIQEAIPGTEIVGVRSIERAVA